MPDKLVHGALVAGLAALLLTTGAAAAGGAQVRIKDIDFSPRTITIERGQSVTWRFLDRSVVHNVTSRGRPRFRGSPTKRSGTYTVRFRKPGTYRYVCTVHPNMRGRVVVR